VPADHKWYRNLVVAQHIVHALEDMDPRPPKVEEIDWTKLRRRVGKLDGAEVPAQAPKCVQRGFRQRSGARRPGRGTASMMAAASDTRKSSAMNQRKSDRSMRFDHRKRLEMCV
jgi:hypothetical protein